MTNEKQRVAKAAGVIGIFTLLSRIFGFIRDMVVAWFFGAGLLTDAFFVAFRIPNLLRRLLAEGSLSMAFVPVFTEYLTQKGKAEAFTMARSVLRLLSVVLVSISIIGIFASPEIVRIMAPGFDGAKYQLTVTLTQIMFPYVFFVCLVALCMGILNVLGHFAAPALAPVFLNLAIIGAALFISPLMKHPVTGLAIGVLIGGILQLGLQIPVLIKKGLYFWQKAPFFHPGVKRIIILMGPAVLGAAVQQINLFIGTLLASLLPDGSISYLYYADRLVEFPLGILAISLSVAVLPTFSRQTAGKNLSEWKNTFAYTMNLTFFITLPALVGLMILSQPIITLLLQHGEFNFHDTVLTAKALVYYSTGLWAFSGVRILLSAFYSLQDTTTPFKIATISVIANILLSIALMGPLLHCGLALATALASMVNFVLLTYCLRKKIGALGGKNIVESITKSMICSIAMGIGLFCLTYLLPTSSNTSFIRMAWIVIVEIVAGISIYGLMAYIIGCQELKHIFMLVKKR
jgi:putative peptidoglycan lipid II flippase